ncbi:MAG: hypothetical protein WAU77_13200 [Solirubrobacteraceae bacterium]
MLAAFAPVASAAPYDMRGEWSIELTSPGQPTLAATGVIGQMNLSTGAFSGNFLATGTQAPVTLEGTLVNNTGSMTATVPTPSGAITFVTSSATINTLNNTVSAPGEFHLGSVAIPGELTGTRTKTYLEVQEREAREQKEREEAQARLAIRGEWALTLESAQTVKGIALVKAAANATNEFTSSSALFESVVLGSFAGTLKGSEASVTIAIQAAGPYPEAVFTGTKITVESADSAMSGTGKLTVGATELTAKLTATRIRTYEQVEAQERSEREAKQAKEAREAREAQEAQERSEKEAKEKQAKEAAEKAERELKERQAREAAEKAKTGPGVIAGTPKTALVSVKPGGTLLTVSHGGTVSLLLTNPDVSPVQGQLKLTLAKAGKASAKHTAVKSITLGTGTFSISPHGSETVRVKLSQSGRSQLARHKSLRVLLTLTTQASGEPSVVNTYSLTLHATKTSGKH